ncbi:hypothetical protein HLB42_21640 (plasmid) [Deinococcus sp. D7000]|nr:hypothetical protein HLB42_13915 [Deinococcus sp. D7000]QLG13545.1 hypothetical protein HLB42_21640 [Deinococcus sp. D7000]
MAITPSVPKTARKISLGFLLKTLQKEWDAHAAHAEPFPEPWEEALFAYYHAGVTVALSWIDGDPYTYRFPREYQGERLARLCGYLQKLETADPAVLIAQRDKQVALLRDVTWPAYEQACVGMNHTGTGGLLPELTYTWDGIDSLWSEHDEPEDKNAPPPYLPKFHAAESEAFHCNALAVLFLNRAAKFPLSDLDITPF